jgi:biotin operon repressor
MSEPANEETRELGRTLLIAAESGQTRHLAELREEMGVSTAELSQMLDTLREHGQAVEVAPGEWRGPLADEVEAAAAPLEPVRVSVPANAEDNGEGRLSPPETFDPLRSGVQVFAPTVRLTMAIANALEPEALGALVKAGISESEERNETFVLEVLP